MFALEKTSVPNKEVRKIAMDSYPVLKNAVNEAQSQVLEVEISETGQRIKLPIDALRLLTKILKVTGEGKPISIVPIATEMTTQAAADLIGCSRPFVIKLLQKGEIPFTKVGRHRRIRFEDVMTYKKRKREEQERLLIEIMQADEEDGLYDT